ncbi:succinylglutamate desuccinylase/aspartoacylase family protein [Natrialbaceae archaeon A-CW1-1]
MTTRHDATSVTLATLPSGVALRTVLHTYEGDTDTDSGDSGPTLYVQAAQHGREINGVETVRRLHEHLLEAELRGRIVVVPVANPITFDRVSYTSPAALDDVNPNMNRVWPGNEDGTIHERMAARLWDTASGADAIIDLHTGSPEMFPHVVVTEGDEASMELARAFGTDLLLVESAHDDAEEEWVKRNFDGKLRVTAHEAGIPCITPELANHTQILEDAVELGVRGLLNVLRSLGILSADPEPNGTPTLARNHLGRVRATESGLFRPDPELHVGERVTKGTFLGSVFDPLTFEEKQRVTADRDGVLYVLTQEATVRAGDTLANVALPLSESN